MAGETIGSVPLDWGITPEVSVILADTVIAVLTPEQRRRVKRDIELPVLHEAPVTEGDSIGVLQLSLDDRLLARVDLPLRRLVRALVLLPMSLCMLSDV